MLYRSVQYSTYMPNSLFSTHTSKHPQKKERKRERERAPVCPGKRSRQIQEQIQHPGEIRGAQARDGIPAADGLEALGATARVRAVRDVVQDVRVLVERRVDEADGVLAAGEALFVDAVDDGREDGGAGASAALERGVAVDVGCDVVTVGGDVGIAAADAVVEAAGQGDAAVEGVGVVGVGRHVVFEKVLDGVFLVVGNGVDVAETAAG